MSQVTIALTTNYLGNGLAIEIHDESLEAALKQLAALNQGQGEEQKQESPKAKKSRTSKAKSESVATEPETTGGSEPTETVTESTPEPEAETAAAETSSPEVTAPQETAPNNATQTDTPPGREVKGEEVLAAAKKLLGTGPNSEPLLAEALQKVGAQTVGTCPADKRPALLDAINEQIKGALL